MDHWNVRMGKINEENTEEDISSYSKEHWYSFQNDIDNKSKHYFRLFTILIICWFWGKYVHQLSLSNKYIILGTDTRIITSIAKDSTAICENKGHHVIHEEKEVSVNKSSSLNEDDFDNFSDYDSSEDSESKCDDDNSENPKKLQEKILSQITKQIKISTQKSITKSSTKSKVIYIWSFS